MAIEGGFISVDEFRKSLGGLLSRDTVYNAIHRGEIPSARIGRKFLIPRDAIERIIQQSQALPRIAEGDNNSSHGGR